jgi:hypothetical protein
MTVNIGILIGGTSQRNGPTIERIQRLRAEAEAASEGIPSDFNLDVTFQISGPVWRPPFHGVRAGRLSAERKYLPVTIGVPEAFSSAAERDRFLWSTMSESAQKAQEAVRRRGFDWSLSGIHQIVSEVLARTVEAPGQNSAMEPKESGTGGLVEPDRATSGRPTLVKLYSLTEAGWRYWEAWHAGGKVTIHSGVVGDRGEVSEVPVTHGQNPQDIIRQAMRRQLNEGFKPLEEADQSRLIVQFASDYFNDVDDALRVWDKVKRLLNDELGWIGVGRCVNVDYSGELTFTVEALEDAIAVVTMRDALDREGLLDRSVIAVERSGQYIAVWPEDRRGDPIAY